MIIEKSNSRLSEIKARKNNLIKNFKLFNRAFSTPIPIKVFIASTPETSSM